MYGTDVSPTLISSVKYAVMDEVKAWQAGPLVALYPIVYLDCIHVKTGDSGVVRAKAVYLALGINMAGEKEILGCGLPRPKGPSSGCRWSRSPRTGAWPTSSSPAWMV
jgi:putative transposase